MTCEGLSDALDVLLNSHAAKAWFGDSVSGTSIQLDEFEKSVLLTMAQDDIVRSTFDARLNVQGQGFDNSERRQAEFSHLVVVANAYAASGTTLDSRGMLYSLSQDPLFVLNEVFIVTRDGQTRRYVIVPIHYREYDRVMSKAYTQPNKKQAWRIFHSASGYDMLSEIVPSQAVYDSIHDTYNPATATYRVQYVRYPDPIVVAALPSGLDVRGQSTQSVNLPLSDAMYTDILNRAVEIAMTTRGGYADAVARFRQEQAQQAQRTRQANEQ